MAASTMGVKRMFRCEKCKQISASGESPVRVIAETRKKVYPERPEAMKRGRGFTLRWVADPGGTGTEIVREELRHAGCV